jgi:aspartate carbamoyltransferase catalytic subunit
MSGSSKHLLQLRGKRPDEIRALLASARELTSPTGRELAGSTVANLFFEDSTRTRVSFTIAAQRLGASVVDLSGKGSSLSKGETLTDTARTVEAMGVDALVVRCAQSGGAGLIAGAVSCAVINAGDGRHEHPTQALTDALTLSSALGRDGDFDLSGVRVAIVGDCAASRVARSNIACLRALGAEVVCCGPASMAPPALATLGCAISHDLDEVVGEVDAVMTLRIQFERNSSIGSAREYRERWGLTVERAERMRPGAWVMHPGPINRGLEIDGEVADGARSLVLGQVANGPRVRMAALSGLLGACRESCTGAG